MVKASQVELETKSAHSLPVLQRFWNSPPKTNKRRQLQRVIERYENVQELLNKESAFSDENTKEEKLLTLRDYLSENIELLTDADAEEDNNKVSLMTTMRRASSSTTYIVGMEENLFPSQRAMDSRADMEERRLFLCSIDSSL